MINNFPTKRYPIVYVDPPWSYSGGQQYGIAGSPTSRAEAHYETMSIPQLCELPVPTILTDDALVFCWTTGPHCANALKVCDAWGLQFATVAFVWDKQRVNPGAYTMSQTEFVYVFKRGRIPGGARKVEPEFKRGARNARQLVSSRRGKHSAKPLEIADRIVEMFPNHSRVELFARDKKPGWDAWGNEV